MNPQSWPKEPWSWQVVGTQPRLFDAKGNDITNDPDAQKRILDAVNSLSGIWFPGNAIPSMNERIERLERLRAEAWARAESLSAQRQTA